MVETADLSYIGNQLVGEGLRDLVVHVGQRTAGVVSEAEVLRAAAALKNPLAAAMVEAVDKVAKSLLQQMYEAEVIIQNIRYHPIFFKAQQSLAESMQKLRELGLQEIPIKNLKHIIKNHIPGGQFAAFGRRSIFNKEIDFVKLAIEGWEKGQLIDPRIKIFDAGEVIGITKQGIPTTKIKISLNDMGNSIRTVFPV